ncbi:MAG TPA: hydrophobe/amphiphile efflux-1 family RND transporter, partial [Chitinophagaceae bacterium]|nr:hydrophobe/amphiphile efflux-1 family RND transporter [Chitinophagaceae bacterium]
FGKLVSTIANRRVVTFGILIVFGLATFGVSNVLPSGFIPTEDQGMIYVNVTTPPGSTVERTEKVLDKVEAITKQNPEVENVSTLAGYSLISEISGASYGMAMINLKPWKQRNKSVAQLIEQLKIQAAAVTDASIEFLPPPTVPGFGNASGFEMRLLNKNRNSDLNETAKVSQAFLEKLRTQPEIGNAFTSFDPSFPQ